MFDVEMTAADAFAETLDRGLIPVVVPVFVHGEPSCALFAFAMSGRVGATASSSDRMLRARLAIGLADIGRARVTSELAAEGVVPV